jgi:hypothetical protein
MSKKQKYMDIKEFREKGYLQEVNRRFLHPLGLALEIFQDENGTEQISGIWDFREDLEGIYYDLENSSEERIATFKQKAEFIQSEFDERFPGRVLRLGFEIEPIPELKNNK